MYFLVKIKYYHNGGYLYIFIRIKSSNSGNTAKKTKKNTSYVKIGFVDW